MHVRMETPGGSVTYDIRAARLASYTPEDIFEKKLYLLIPFYIFNCEGGFNEYDNDEEKEDGRETSIYNILEDGCGFITG